VLKPGEAARIATGAPVPRGADAVLMLEWSGRCNGTVQALREVRPGENVRRRGEDVSGGGAVLQAGTPLGAGEIALLAAVGRDVVRVFPRVRATVLSNGNEIRQPGEGLSEGGIYDSNRFLVSGRLAEWGCVPRWAGCVKDDRNEVKTVLAAAGNRDLVVTTAGVSVGDRDHFPDVLRSLGADIVVHGVRAKPGKPFLFADWEGCPVFGLPGSPTASAVAAELFLRPAVLRMRGHDDVSRPRWTGIWRGGTYGKKRGRRLFLFVSVRWSEGGFVIAPTSPPGSSRVYSTVNAGGLLDLPPDRGDLEDGQKFEFMPLSFPPTVPTRTSLPGGEA
jgi:molybdopterin molybdotransferase